MLELWQLVRHDICKELKVMVEGKACMSLLHGEGKHLVVFSVEASWGANVEETDARTKLLVPGDYGVWYGARGEQ